MDKLLSMSVMGAIGILLTALLKKLLGTRLSSRAHLFIWLPAMVKLMIPYTPQSQLSIYNYIPQYDPVSSVAQAVSQAVFVSIPVLAVLWMVGVFALPIVSLFSYKRFCRSLIPTEPTAEMQELTKKALRLCKLQKSVEIIYVKNPVSPLTFGGMRPKMILPESIFSDFKPEEAVLMISHECMHIMHRDWFINLFLLLLRSIYWFHPAVHYMARSIKLDLEHLCDEGTLKCFHGTDTPYVYSKTILSLTEHTKPHLNGIASSMSEGKRTLKSRLEYIYSFSKKKLTAIVLPLCIMMSIFFLTGAIEKEVVPVINTVVEHLPTVPLPLPTATPQPTVRPTAKPTSTPSSETLPPQTEAPPREEPMPIEKLYHYQSHHAQAIFSNDLSQAGFQCNTGELVIRTNKVTGGTLQKINGYFSISRNGEVLEENIKGTVSATPTEIHFSAGSEHRYSFPLLSKKIE